MSGKKQLLADVAERFGLIAPLRLFHDRGRRSLTILAYHRVLALDANGSYPFDPELISASPIEFDWQMQYLRENMNPVSLAQVIQSLNSSEPLPHNAVAVTFDDGFIDSYTNAFPMLLRHHIPATVFVSTQYVDSGEPFWFEVVAHLMMKLDPHTIEMNSTSFPFGTSDALRRRSLRAMHEILKSVPDAHRTSMIKQWMITFADRVDMLASDLSRPISWTKIGEMAASGIEFGSHTVTHPNLTQISDQALQWEMGESKRVLEMHLAHPVRTFAYPIGLQGSFDERVMRAARAAKYELAVSYQPGVNWANAMQRFSLRRYGVGRWMSRSYFRTLLEWPAWFK